MQTAASIWGFAQTIIALLTIIRHTHSWETLPFITPLLWLNWATIWSLANRSTKIPYIAALSATVGATLWGVCLWLTLGYSIWGYGVRQYDVLSVPGACQSLDISWETDPRRRHFVRLHAVIFFSGSLGLTLFVIQMSKRLKWRHVKAVFNRKSDNNEDNARSIEKWLKWIVAVFIILPVGIGVIIAAAVNSHSFLLLGQKGCYASFVSGRFGYFDLVYRSWETRLLTWAGLNS